MADPDLDAVLLGKADLRQVGWFCAGGHECPSKRMPGTTVKARPSLRMGNDRQCDHAVPTYVLVKT